MDELDHILLEQLHSVKKQLTLVHRLKKIINDHVNLGIVEHRIHGKIKFLESMIQDKSLLKKRKKKSKRSPDIFDRNPILTYYKTVWFIATLSFGMIFNWYKERK